MALTDSSQDHDSLSFWKMEGCGNNFIVCIPQNPITAGLAKRLCNPHFGIGADGVMAITRSHKADFDVEMFNPDGSSMGMCGNGIRCATSFVHELGLIDKNEIHFLVEGRSIICEVDGDIVQVDMGAPILDAKSISLEVGVRSFEAISVSMGNPHAVIFVDILPNSTELKDWGSVIERDPQFPARTNVEFVKINNQQSLDVRVWERGAGATLACGTGACASVVAGVRRGFVHNKAEVHLPGGTVKVEWDKTRDTVILSGYARKVFEGVIEVIWN